MKKPWRTLMAQKQSPPPAWKRGPNGAIPVTSKQRRRQRRGAAAMAANRGSARMHRLLRSAFVSVIEMLALIALATLFGRFLYNLYNGASVGRAVLQAVVAAVAVIVWLNLTHNRYRADTREAIASERAIELGADQEEHRPRGAGLGGAPAPDPTPTGVIKPAEDITTNWPPERDPRSNFEREFDQRRDWDKPVG